MIFSSFFIYFFTLLGSFEHPSAIFAAVAEPGRFLWKVPSLNRRVGWCAIFASFSALEALVSRDSPG